MLQLPFKRYLVTIQLVTRFKLSVPPAVPQQAICDERDREREREKERERGRGRERERERNSCSLMFMS